MFNNYPRPSEAEYEKNKSKLNALNNPVRLNIVEGLKNKEKMNFGEDYIENYSMNTHEIHRYLIENNINIGRQMLSQHLRKLLEAGLIDRIRVHHNGNGAVPMIYSYFLKEDAFDDLLLDLNFFRDEINTFVEIYKNSESRKCKNNCVVTVLNGIDKGKILTINEDETAFIGRQSADRPIENPSLLVLSRSYNSVSKISEPHLKVFNKNGTWFMLDESSSNGTYYSNKELKKGEAKEIPNNSVVQLSKGEGSVKLYFTYNQ
ncbi:MAG: hypothetical protein BZ137_00750 [Methanosphaera sp. rholeuAM130]|nr:MAG: hypothetical protein BZ137_00750 [Methanosphaera sp. rholeuAM130]